MRRVFGPARRPLFQYDGIFNTGNARALTSTSHWVGASFIAAKTATIDKICFSVTAVSAAAGTIEAVICALDANGYPLGSAVATSSSTLDASTAAANTDYELDISAAVTGGTAYGVRVYPATWSGTSITIKQLHSPLYTDATYVGFQFPCPSFNIGTDTKNNGLSSIGLRYGATDGYLPTPGLGGAASTTTESTAATSGNCLGNTFTVDRPFYLSGYLAYGEFDNDPIFALFSGTDNTVMTGTDVTLESDYRASVSTGSVQITLAAPVLIPAGNYRVAIKNGSAAANTLAKMRYITVTARMKQIFGDFSVQKTVYASGSWTDTDTEFVGIFPLVDSYLDAPIPAFALGI